MRNYYIPLLSMEQELKFLDLWLYHVFVKFIVFILCFYYYFSVFVIVINSLLL